MKFNKNFIGYDRPNDALVKDGIIFKYNNFGHRCKDVDQIDLNNYILFAGCSHTEGEGLDVPDTYPYITAQELQCDYYNLGIPASGFDVLFYNVMTWLHTYPKPKLLVLQYPDQSRFSTLMSESALVVPYGPWRKTDKDLEFITQGQESGMFLFRNFTLNKLLSMYIDIPCIRLVFGPTKSYDHRTIRIDRLDYAADGKHYGVDTHRLCADIIRDKYQNAIINTTA